MKQLIAFLSTFIIIMMVGIIFLLGSGKSSLKNKVINAVGSFVSEAGLSDKEGSVFDSKLSKDSKESKANPITKAVVEKAMDAYIETADSDTKAIFNSMSEEDKDIVTDIIAENVSLDSISEVQSYVAKGDKDAVAKYAQENLSEEDQKILIEIMSKYIPE